MLGRHGVGTASSLERFHPDQNRRQILEFWPNPRIVAPPVKAR
jgi:hypothetical protein